MGKRPGSVFYITHVAYTGTCDIAHFPDVVFQLKIPVDPMVCSPLPEHLFHPDIPPDCASPKNYVVRIWVVCSTWVSGYPCQYVIRFPDITENISSQNTSK